MIACSIFVRNDRFNSDGSRGASIQIGDDPPDLVAVQPDGRLLVLVHTNGEHSVFRVGLDGRVDPTFKPFPWSGAILRVSDSRIWILTRTESLTEYLLLRRNADGSDAPTWTTAALEGSFGGYGPAFDLLTEPDGNLLLVHRGGPWPMNGQPRVGLTRLLVNEPLPRVEVDQASAMVPENGGRVSITLVRCGPKADALTVTWRTEGGTARPGVDYVPASGALTFLANQSLAMLTLEILDNAVPDADRTVRLLLQGPPPGNQQNPAIELTIINDDLGILPAGMKRFLNGRVLLHSTGRGIEVIEHLQGGTSNYSGFYIEASENLRDWSGPVFGGDYSTVAFGSPEWLDKTSPGQPQRFYRIKRETQ
jgi:hypothetical protein